MIEKSKQNIYRHIFDFLSRNFKCEQDILARRILSSGIVYDLKPSLVRADIKHPIEQDELSSIHQSYVTMHERVSNMFANQDSDEFSKLIDYAIDHPDELFFFPTDDVYSKAFEYETPDFMIEPIREKFDQLKNALPTGSKNESFDIGPSFFLYQLLRINFSSARGFRCGDLRTHKLLSFINDVSADSEEMFSQLALIACMFESGYGDSIYKLFLEESATNVIHQEGENNSLYRRMSDLVYTGKIKNILRMNSEKYGASVATSDVSLNMQNLLTSTAHGAINSLKYESNDNFVYPHENDRVRFEIKLIGLTRFLYSPQSISCANQKDISLSGSRPKLVVSKNAGILEVKKDDMNCYGFKKTSVKRLCDLVKAPGSAFAHYPLEHWYQDDQWMRSIQIGNRETTLIDEILGAYLEQFKVENDAIEKLLLRSSDKRLTSVKTGFDRCMPSGIELLMMKLRHEGASVIDDKSERFIIQLINERFRSVRESACSMLENRAWADMLALVKYDSVQLSRMVESFIDSNVPPAFFKKIYSLKEVKILLNEDDRLKSKLFDSIYEESFGNSFVVANEKVFDDYKSFIEAEMDVYIKQDAGRNIADDLEDIL